jgi:hypothetical protein
MRISPLQQMLNICFGILLGILAHQTRSDSWRTTAIGTSPASCGKITSRGRQLEEDTTRESYSWIWTNSGIILAERYIILLKTDVASLYLK